MMMNPKLTNFLATLDVPNFSDSHDVSALAALPDLERQVAHNALIARARHGDARAIISVGHLGLSDAVPYLRLLTTHPSRWVRFSVHRAMAMLGFAEGVRPLIDDASHGIMIERFAAAMDLTHVPGEEALAALLAGLEDVDYLVRARAMQSLTIRFGIDDLRRDREGQTLPESPLETLELLLTNELAPLWQYAAWQARTIFQALNEGVDPDALCLRYLRVAPEGFRDSIADNFFEPEAPFDVTPILAAWGADRRWAEAFLGAQLAQRPVRAVQAIVTLGADWLGGALEASTVGADDAYRAHVAAALAQLTRRG